jgi:hypothetical protein
VKENPAAVCHSWNERLWNDRSWREADIRQNAHEVGANGELLPINSIAAQSQSD